MPKETENPNSPSNPSETSPESTEEDPTLEGGTEESPEQELGGQEQESTEEFEPGAVEGAEVFIDHPRLGRLTGDKAREYIATLEATVQDQGRALSGSKPKEEAPSSEPEKPAKGFWDDPEGYLGHFENRIKGFMEESIKPFREDLTASKMQTARQQLRQKYANFGIYEPYINESLRQQNVDPDSADPRLLEATYFTVRGLVAEGLIKLDGSNAPSNSSRPEETVSTPKPKNAPPQHRPSAAPLPAQESSKPKRRQLTENERRLARFYNMTNDEYLDELEKNADEVVSPGFSSRGE